MKPRHWLLFIFAILMGIAGNTVLGDCVGVTDILEAIREVETGGHPDPANAVGDGGRSRGPMQISRAYFKDAKENNPKLVGVAYEEVSKLSISYVVVLGYWNRYGKTFTAEELCRLHNGGPSKKGTDAYWEKCKAILIKLSTECKE